jgi:hypothetical protein
VFKYGDIVEIDPLLFTPQRKRDIIRDRAFRVIKVGVSLTGQPHDKLLILEPFYRNEDEVYRYFINGSLRSNSVWFDEDSGSIEIDKGYVRSANLKTIVKTRKQKEQ